jgi:hypothetical protein
MFAAPWRRGPHPHLPDQGHRRLLNAIHRDLRLARTVEEILVFLMVGRLDLPGANLLRS